MIKTLLITISGLIVVFRVDFALAQTLKWKLIKGAGFSLRHEETIPLPDTTKYEISISQTTPIYISDEEILFDQITHGIIMRYDRKKKEMRPVFLENYVPGTNKHLYGFTKNRNIKQTLVFVDLSTSLLFDEPFIQRPLKTPFTRFFTTQTRLLDDGTTLSWVGGPLYRPKNPDHHFEWFNPKSGEIRSFGHVSGNISFWSDLRLNRSETFFCKYKDFIIRCDPSTRKIVVLRFSTGKSIPQSFKMSENFIAMDTSTTYPPEKFKNMSLEEGITFMESATKYHTRIWAMNIVGKNNDVLAIYYQSKSYHDGPDLGWKAFSEKPELIYRKGFIELFDLTVLETEKSTKKTHEATGIMEVKQLGTTAYMPSLHWRNPLIHTIDNGKFIVQANSTSEYFGNGRLKPPKLEVWSLEKKP